MSEAERTGSTTSSSRDASPAWRSSSATFPRPPTTSSTPSSPPSRRPATPSSIRGPAPAGPRAARSPHGMRAVAADPEPVRAARGHRLPHRARVRPCLTRRSRSWRRRGASTCRSASTSRSSTRRAAPRAARPVVVDQFIWPRDADAPGRKIYRCAACEAALGGPEERVAPVDEVDLAKLGLERGTAAPEPLGDAAARTSCRPRRSG